MVFSSVLSEMAFIASRVLFAVVIGYLAVGNLLDTESAVGYAKSKGVPLATISVPLGSLGLIVGALSILTGAYAAVGALLIVVFLVPITVLMHDFWTMQGQERQNEQIHFLKNIGLIGSALVFFALTTVTWPLAVGMGI